VNLLIFVFGFHGISVETGNKRRKANKMKDFYGNEGKKTRFSFTVGFGPEADLRAGNAR
jgi:hypothetical protein